MAVSLLHDEDVFGHISLKGLGARFMVVLFFWFYCIVSLLDPERNCKQRVNTFFDA